ncbi:hypothetical protein H4R24_001676 [Coemansia sp. RSA 988]|nr:hypothetical protein H4R24_001676 [Coemansia sp. RSA 988]
MESLNFDRDVGRWSTEVRPQSDLATLRDNPFVYAGKDYPWSTKTGRVIYNILLGGGDMGATVLDLNKAVRQISYIINDVEELYFDGARTRIYTCTLELALEEEPP